MRREEKEIAVMAVVVLLVALVVIVVSYSETTERVGYLSQRADGDITVVSSI